MADDEAAGGKTGEYPEHRKPGAEPLSGLHQEEKLEPAIGKKREKYEFRHTFDPWVRNLDVARSQSYIRADRARHHGQEKRWTRLSIPSIC